MRFSYFILSLVFGIHISNGQINNEESKQLNPTVLADYETFVQSEINKGNIAGAEVLISKDNVVRWHHSWGFSNIDSKSPLELNSIYYIQSMTKPIISVAVMQLFEKGYFSLDEDLSQFIPELKGLEVALNPEDGLKSLKVPLKHKITARQLLTHTAGFSHGLGDNKLEKQLFKALYYDDTDYNLHQNIENRVKILFEFPLVGQPDAQWYYSAATDVLSLLIERVTGKTTAEYLKTSILEPLGMNNTAYNLNKLQEKRVMLLHNFNEKGKLIVSKIQVPTANNSVFGGTHGLYSTAKDYWSFCQMILNNGTHNGKRILKKETVKLMTENNVGNLFYKGNGFGLGFGIITNPKMSATTGNFGQLYWGGYFRTHFFIDPSEKLIAIWMTQLMPHDERYSEILKKYVYKALK